MSHPGNASLFDLCCFALLLLAQMITVVCDASKMKVLLEQCDKCSKLKNIVKIGAAVTEEEKEAGEKVGVKVISFKELEVSEGN